MLINSVFMLALACMRVAQVYAIGENIDPIVANTPSFQNDPSDDARPIFINASWVINT